jgi:hypothetical protein
MDIIGRPRGLTATTILMSITNAMGWAIIDWSKPHARATFVFNTVMIAIGYVVLWFYWHGKNWARILVLLTCLLGLGNLLLWNHVGLMSRIMIGADAVLAIFLLYWLNTATAKAFFRGERVDPPTC